MQGSNVDVILKSLKRKEINKYEDFPWYTNMVKGHNHNRCLGQIYEGLLIYITEEVGEVIFMDVKQ